MPRLCSGTAAIAASVLIAAAFLGGILVGPLVKPAAGEPASRSTVSPSASPRPPEADYVGSLELAPAQGRIGSQATLAGAGFEPGHQLDVIWQAYSGAWVIDDAAEAGENYKGRTYQEDAVPLGSVTADAAGAFSTSFTVPDGFGFTHNVQVREGAVVRNQTAFSVEMEVSVSPSSGPVGTPITVDVRGIGVSPLHSSWELTYDNRFTGWMSAVTTDGHARFTVPATGAPGPHVLKILHGSFTFPYLNMQQSPDPGRPTFMSIFTVTPGEPVTPPPPGEQWDPVVSGSEPNSDGPTIWTDPLETIVGDRVSLNGRDLPAGASLKVGWLTQVGVDTAIIGGTGENRPTADWDLGTAEIGSDGSLAWEFEIPADKGGWHEISLMDGETVVAATQVRVRPMAEPLAVTQVRVGDVLTLHVTGVDDTDTGKIMMLVYDNGMLGYSCSVTGQGDITIYVPAAGEPGWHFIDLYPGIYKGEDAPGTYNYRIPQLTFQEDHPGETMTAFRFAFEIVP
jgi:hypothetical protein